MQINREYEPEINLKDAFFHVLYRWRSILIAALIGAIALGAYQYFSIQSVHKEGKLTKEERQYQLDLQNYHENLEGTRTTIDTLTRTLEGQRKYQAGSIYIRMDAQNIWTAEAKYLVKVDQSVINALPAGSSIDPADTILPAYASPLAEGVDDAELREAFNTEETQYISELVSVGTSTGENTVTVYVRSSTREGAEKGLALVNRQIQAIASGKAQEINPHELVLLSQTTTLGADDTLIQKQTALTTAMQENQTALQNARTKLDDLEAKDEPAEPGTHVKKMAAIGFILGAFLLAGLYLMLYILNGRLKDSGEITEAYTVPVLAEFPRSGARRPGKGIDKLLEKWELKDKLTDSQTIYDNLAALVREQKEAKNILLTSTLPESKLKPVLEQLAGRLQEKDLSMQADFLNNPEAVPAASAADSVLLVEEKGESMNRKIEQAANSLIIAEARVTGAIIL